VFRACFILAAVIWLTGCAMPTYVPDFTTPHAGITLSPSTLRMPFNLCDGSKCYVLAPSTGTVWVPIGHRISVYSVFTQGVLPTVSCTPGSSFIPQSGLRYYANLSISRRHKCTLFVYRLMPGGLIYEPTMRPAQMINKV
jgi:hypothetical protein